MHGGRFWAVPGHFLAIARLAVRGAIVSVWARLSTYWAGWSTLRVLLYENDIAIREVRCFR